MAGKRMGALLAIAGVALVVISALADPIGIGGGGGFGWKQVVGVIVGAVAAVLGALAMRGRAA